MTHIALEPQASCARTWLLAVRTLLATPDKAAYNVIMSVLQPKEVDASDTSVIRKVDEHLSKNDCYPTRTAANTIFPQGLLQHVGPSKLYSTYMESVAPRFGNRGWGRYFERMISHPCGTSSINPLQNLIAKIEREVARSGGVGHAFEMTLTDPTLSLSIYDPCRDANYVRGQQCLSFLSFHVTTDNRLHLTATYRNHSYIARLLGNLVGLTNLMSFVARQSGTEVGNLTVLSTHAEIDTPGGLNAIRQLVTDCTAVYDNTFQPMQHVTLDATAD